MRAALLLLGACTASGPEPWGQGAMLAPGDDPEWTEQVTKAAGAWNAALPDCGPVLLLGGDRPVLREAGAGWPATTMGRFDGETVRIRPGLAEWELPVLVHELGHALGFPHVTDDPASVMTEASRMGEWTPSPGDVARAYALLGCP